MNNQILIIYDFPILFDILSEIKKALNFKLINLSKEEFSESKIKNYENYLIITNEKFLRFENQIVITEFPMRVSKIIEIININFLKKKFNQQSEINIGLYKLNLNSRKLFNEKNELDLTEKEADIIIFLNQSKKPVTINQLQKQVWDHSSKLETHTVETHIYRLRKKITDVFDNKYFIKSTKLGYTIK